MNTKLTSFIYSDILASIGFFEPKIPFSKIDDSVNFVKFINEPRPSQTISNKTLVAYFPGCFAEFHVGHLDVVKQAVERCKAITDDYLVVIAPANSDYTTEKYGKDSLFATNKYRYDRICSMLAGIDGNVAIDLNTMLNYKVDYNFTDLIFDFITRQNVRYDELVHVPRIVCGKDRDYFVNLVKLTDKIEVLYVEDTTGASSSGHIRTMENGGKLVKKNLLLRCNNRREYNLFSLYFEEQYSTIALQLVDDEIELAKELDEIYNFDVTICKEYASFLPYIETHRIFENPLEDSKSNQSEGFFDGFRVLDSDIFSGGTKKFIEKNGGTLYAVHDFSNQIMNDWELLDISDFYDDKFCYPYVDISSRCSMTAFNLETHIKFETFKSHLKGMKKG